MKPAPKLRFPPGSSSSSELRSPLLASVSKDVLIRDEDEPSQSTPDERLTPNQIWWLVTLNRIAFWLHLISGILSLVVILIFRDRSFLAEIVTVFRGYNGAAMNPVQAGPFSTLPVSRGFYQLIWVDLPFPFITALFHGLIGYNECVRNYYLSSLSRGKGNSLRWYEYAITASLMTWVIPQLAGVTDPTLLTLLVVCNIALQLCGMLQEKVSAVTWLPTLIGWLIFCGQWFGVIIPYFYEAVSSPRPATAEQVPWFVYSIIIGLFFMFAVFGLIQLTGLLAFPLFMGLVFYQEIAYIAMSFTSKLFLTWNLNIGMALAPMT